MVLTEVTFFRTWSMICKIILKKHDFGIDVEKMSVINRQKQNSPQKNREGQVT